MGKRSNFERVERDFYPTPREAVLPLLPHWTGIISGVVSFIEPCAGNGVLAEYIVKECRRNCIFYMCDIEPQSKQIIKRDALTLTEKDCEDYDYIVTNTPWTRSILHPMIEHFRNLRPTWLLIDANWMFTKQAKPYLKYCGAIVNIGRVKWIPDSKHTGKDDCCWYLFDKKETVTIFYND